MEPDELDRWLSDDEAIVPSSGFAAAAMEAVRREASAPPAIPFPWIRALPGLAATTLALAWVLITGLSAIREAAAHASQATALPGLFATLVDIGMSAATVWAVVAALLAVLPVMWSMRLTRGY